MTVKVALVGSRFFGASALAALMNEPGVQISCVVTIAEDDRLALAARKAGLPVHVLANPKVVPGEAISESSDVIVAAHTHARVSNEALARTRLGGVGYHPSLLPRHRGIAAVEWTILSGDPIAGGSVYHLADGWDKGAVAAQDWCFVRKDDDARSLWERELAPMGLRLLCQVVRQAGADGKLPAFEQDNQFATRAPMLHKAVTLDESNLPMTTSLAVTVVGDNRPGIVSQLADKAQRFGANWTHSQMVNMDGQFAGMAHLDVPAQHADALARTLVELEGTGLKVTVAKSGGNPPQSHRTLTLGLIGDDRVGIVSRVTALLAGNNISIEQLSTELVQGAGGRAAFKVNAQLQVPKAVNTEELSIALGDLARELTLDFKLGEPH
ncbi:MAG: hypothetical protein RLZZ126_1947 [Pseudomonadota bacterium]